MADAIPTAVAEERKAALGMLTTTALGAAGLAGVTAAFNRARRAAGRIASAVATTVTTAAAHAVTTLARLLGPGIRLLWVAEPGACDACAAYAGHAVRPGSRFPGGLSLNPRRASFPAPIAGPPRHPHCRCVLIPWHPDWHTGRGTPLPELLRRRARPAPARRR